MSILRLSLLLTFFHFPAIAADPPAKPELRRALGIGFAYTGGLLRWGFKEVWSVEAHYLFGSAGSNDSDVKAQVYGSRGYRYFRPDKRLQFFAGPEVGYITAKSSVLKTTGYIVGGFAGMEYYLTRRFSIGLDLGPYYTHVKEKSINFSDSGMDFILNSFLTFYIL